jgi:hypothetical protein
VIVDCPLPPPPDPELLRSAIRHGSSNFIGYIVLLTCSTKQSHHHQLLYTLSGPELKQLRLLLRPLAAPQDSNLLWIINFLLIHCAAVREIKSIYLSIFVGTVWMKNFIWVCTIFLRNQSSCTLQRLTTPPVNELNVTRNNSEGKELQSNQ